MADPSSPTGTGTLDGNEAGVTTQVVSYRGVDVVVANTQVEIEVDIARWAALAAAVLVDEGQAGELTLTFIERGEMAELNGEFKDVDGPTDVLSFPCDALDDSDPSIAARQPILLGDIVVCPGVAAQAAPTHAGTVDDELALLTVHGVLHILGHDHAEPQETARMRAAELKYLTRHHWDGPAPDGFVQEQQ